MLGSWTVLLGALLLGPALADDGPLAEPPLGKVRGHTMTSRSGRKYLAFSGVPYAKPPVGPLRFQAPQPLEPWKETRDAKQNGPHCIQHNFFIAPPNAEGVEDCLYLNVYTHNVSGSVPVFAVFHGGGYVMGNGDMMKPTYLMDADVVVVNINYRLGIFGFLSFESREMPGNQGMKDQVMALRWIQENIASFGGNPEKVTIMGMSAGGSSVYHHFISPLSKGLFHRGIASSGSSYNPWALSPPGLARANAQKLMGLLGCPIYPEEGIPCIMKKDASEIVNQFKHFIEFQRFDPMLTFSPVLEEPGPGACIPGPVSEWDHNPAPLIMILSSAEGLFRYQTLKSSIKEFNDNFDKIAPVTLYYWASASKPEEVTKKVREFYFPGNKEITLKDYVNITNMYSDSWFTHGIIEGANKHKGELYFLLFDFFVCDDGDEECKLGANHCGENPYLWELNIPGMKVHVPKEGKPLNVSQDLVKMIVKFMDAGVPPVFDTGLPWKPWTLHHNNFVHLSNSGCKLKEGLLEERFKFWDTVNYKDRFGVQVIIQH